MKVTIDDVKRIAALARLEFTPEEEKALVNELSAILDYMELLDEVVPSGEAAEKSGTLPEPVERMDETGTTMHREEALKRASKSSGEFFTVPKVIR